MVCHPSHTSLRRFSSREVAMMRVIWSTFRQLSGVAGSAHHLPLPYVA